MDTAPRLRVTTDDIGLAATWLESYESSNEDPNERDEAAEAMQRVAAWLRAEEARRTAAAYERKVVADVLTANPGATRAAARRAVRRAMNTTAAP